MIRHTLNGALWIAVSILGTPAILASEPGDRLVDCDECPELVVIPAGTFAMGADRIEP